MRWLLLWTLSVVSFSSAHAQIVMPAKAHYNLVALRVEFSPDTTRFTTGDGTFDGLTYPLEPAVDPLPHDASYFEAHLDFLKHYVKTASSGKTVLSAFLIPEIIRLNRPMASYSPIGEDSESDAEVSKLAQLIDDAWTEADRQSSFDPSSLTRHDDTAFMVFHAGVGRDIELTGTTLDKTPQDLPSLYMSSEYLQRLGVEGIVFKGMKVNHSMIIPRTETRSGVNSITDEPFLLQLSINGLLAASFLSYLGVPDLFNTETGASVIGPFGVMDPLGIFAYGGLFPPLPSAWTRSALGWVVPTIIHESGSYELLPRDVTKIEVSPAEYFLLENRLRTPDQNGLILQISNQGVTTTQSIEEVRDDFNRFNVEAFQGGVVTEVNSYDFALPGWDIDGQQYNGGILIWHIDERQFAHGVNNDLAAFAVDIEEADGAQDIGFDGNIGSPFDFYYQGNPSSVSLPSGRVISLYENRFGPDTYPNSDTNAGGNSFIMIEDFSPQGPIMSFTLTRSLDGLITSLPSVSLDASILASGSVSSIGQYFAVFTGTQMIVPEIGHVPSVVRPAFSMEAITSISYDEGNAVTFNRYEFADQRLSLIHSFGLSTQLTPRSPVVYHDQSYYILFTNSDQSEVLRIAPNNAVNTYSLNGHGLGLVATDDGMYVVGNTHTGPLGENPFWTYSVDAPAGFPVMGRDRTGLWGVIPRSDHMIFLQPDGTVVELSASSYFGEDQFSGSVAMADINQDGLLDIVTTVGRQIVAFSQGGALLPPLPVDIGASSVVAPLIYESEEGIVVMIAAIDGNIYAVDLSHDRGQVSGFPLSAGYSIEAMPLISSDGLTVVTQRAVLRKYTIGNISRIHWAEQHGNPQNTSFVSLSSELSSTSTLLNPTETYNWPNPIRDGSTFFRCQTSEPSAVTVTIIDAAGSLIDSFQFSTTAEIPQDVLWQTDAPSGIYYARMEALSISGIKESRLIKLAVIR